MAPESHLILRSLGFANLFLAAGLLRARRRGARITIDVPSPNRVAVNEIWRSRQSLWRRLRTVTAFYVSGPWSLWPASRIVQYAPEGWWFRIGNTLAHGRDRQRHRRRSRSSRAAAPPAWPSPRLHLIAVASVARWHGYDRLLRAVREFQDRNGRTFDVHVTIVGDGPSLPHLRELVASLRLSDHVTFAGIVTGDALRVFTSRRISPSARWACIALASIGPRS